MLFNGGFNWYFPITHEGQHVFLFIGHLDVLTCKYLVSYRFLPLSFLSFLMVQRNALLHFKCYLHLCG